MKKTKKSLLILFLMTLVFTLQTTSLLAYSSPPDPWTSPPDPWTSPPDPWTTPNDDVTYGTVTQSEYTSPQDINAILQGTIKLQPKIISAIVPTKVNFILDPTNSSWNQVISPNAKITNTGNVPIDVLITKAQVSGSNISLVNTMPIFDNNIRQARLAFAPTSSNYSSYDSTLLRYTLLGSISDSNSLLLQKNLSQLVSSNSAFFTIYGNASQGWSQNEQFGVNTVFKIKLAQ